jgi:hypothetical protein
VSKAKLRGKFVVAAVGVGVVGAPMAAPAFADNPPGSCVNTQLGLYTQANYEGHCYGFAGDNVHYDDPWAVGIRDNMRSAWNGGTSGARACVYRNKNYASRVSSLAMGQHYSWGSVQGAESNKWRSGSCPT